MTVDGPAHLGLRLRSAGGRVILTRTAEGQVQRTGRRALFLFLTRDIPDASGTDTAASSRARAECGLLLEPASDGSHDRLVAVTTRHPSLEDPTEALSWAEPPAGAVGAEALMVPLIADLLDLVERMALEQNMPVAIHGGGLPVPILAGPLTTRGARTATVDSLAATERPERRHLLYRPDAAGIGEYLSCVADGSLIAIYSPEAGDLVYDFYPHIHRRGLHIVHGAARDGRPLSESEWRMTHNALLEASIPVALVTKQHDSGEPVTLDLPPETGAFILQIDV